MEFLVLSLFGLAGIAIHLLMKFRDAITKEPKDGRTLGERFAAVWKGFDLLGNILYAVFALVVVVICVSLRDKLLTLGFPITEVTVIFVGYAADSALKNLMPESKE